MSSIDDIKYNFDVGARANRFEVRFLLPFKYFGSSKKVLSKIDGTKRGTDAEGTEEARQSEVIETQGRFMGMRVESCSLPGRTIGTTEYAEQGAVRAMPTGQVSDGNTIDFTFICDQSFADRLIIEAWQQTIFTAGENKPVQIGQDATDDQEGVEASDGGVVGTAFMPKMAWYDDFIGEVEIIQQRIDGRGKEDGAALKYTLKEAYPVSFQPQTLSMAQEGAGIMKFSCSIAYRYWESQYFKAPKRSALNKGRVLLDSLLSGSNLLSRFGKEGKMRKTLTNLDTRTSQIANIFGGG